MSLRHAARAMVDRAAALTGVLGARERAMRGGLTVLMYHRVLPDERCRDYHLPSLAMPLSAFREQVAYLSAHFQIVTVRKGLDLLKAGAVEGPALVSFTFDDGYADNFALAAPALEESGARGSFYVTTGLIGTDRRLWFDGAAIGWACLDWRRVDEAVAGMPGCAPPTWTARESLSGWMGYLKLLSNDQRQSLLDKVIAAGSGPPDALDRLMTAEELRVLDRRGHEIGSHSVTHPLLPRLEDDELAEELMKSRAHIASWLGAAPAGFCYPNGDFDDRVESATRSAGYTYACTTRAGRNPPSWGQFRLHRIDMNPRRVTREGVHDELAVRGEIALLHEAVR